METGTETTHQVCGNLQGFLVPSPGEQGIEPGLPGHPLFMAKFVDGSFLRYWNTPAVYFLAK